MAELVLNLTLLRKKRKELLDAIDWVNDHAKKLRTAPRDGETDTERRVRASIDKDTRRLR